MSGFVLGAIGVLGAFTGARLGLFGMCTLKMPSGPTISIVGVRHRKGLFFDKVDYVKHVSCSVLESIAPHWMTRDVSVYSLRPVSLGNLAQKQAGGC